MIHYVVDFARRQGAEKVVARYQPTPKNSPCLKFFRQSGFEEHGNDTFVWNCVRAFPQYDAIALSIQAPEMISSK
jgi:predicted enzyme involved in methoxymalonyl-ACP biosynthesis